jgi:hypothetical protein
MNVDSVIHLSLMNLDNTVCCYHTYKVKFVYCKKNHIHIQCDDYNLNAVNIVSLCKLRHGIHV